MSGRSATIRSAALSMRSVCIGENGGPCRFQVTRWISKAKRQLPRSIAVAEIVSEQRDRDSGRRIRRPAVNREDGVRFARSPQDATAQGLGDYRALLPLGKGFGDTLVSQAPLSAPAPAVWWGTWGSPKWRRQGPTPHGVVAVSGRGAVARAGWCRPIQAAARQETQARVAAHRFTGLWPWRSGIRVPSLSPICVRARLSHTECLRSASDAPAGSPKGRIVWTSLGSLRMQSQPKQPHCIRREL